MNKNAATTSTSSDGKLPKSYKRTLVVTQVAGVLMIILSSLWMGKFDDGFRLPEEPGIYYAYHVLLMTCSVIEVLAVSAAETCCMEFFAPGCEVR
ncbi:hypothetical protein Y032_0850g2684 [Ancylostoma ceylanicum]|uniref:Uncharacterized protein n=1 Tax=Ancylostoma ceylanicum TaxID=53326 RepID=A0A016WB64_9BILA|nr:hypothetical protein Y032_0850g2684 [Ancylostoma ceylanicum]